MAQEVLRKVERAEGKCKRTGDAPQLVGRLNFNLPQFIEGQFDVHYFASPTKSQVFLWLSGVGLDNGNWAPY